MSIQLMLQKNKQYIINEYINGKSTNKIANELKCSAGMVYGFLKENNINIRTKGNYNLLENNIDNIIDLYNSGYSAYKIAKKFNCSKSSVLSFLKKRKLSTSY